MQGGSFRGSRAADKRAASGGRLDLGASSRASASRPAASSESSRQAPSPATSSSSPQSPPIDQVITPKKRWKVPVFTTIAVLVIGAASWLLYPAMHGAIGIDNDKYQAVFLTNGQVYFGKLGWSFSRNQVSLTDVYYLQTQTESGTDSESGNPQQAATNQSDVQLVKLGDEIHGPEDEMIISREQILFYENLKSDGRVVESIDQHQAASR